MRIGIVILLGITLIVLGVTLLLVDFMTYVRKKLTEGFGLIWILLAVLFLVAGIVLLVAEQITSVVWIVMILLMVILTTFLFGISRIISILVMKNQELAMQVSLLNQENESILQDLNELKEKHSNE